MSEAAPMRGVLLGHGSMAAGMVDALRHITGADEDALTPLSNRGMSPESLTAEVERVLGGAAGVVFTDLPSGSCGFVARRLAQTLPGVVVVSGVNLPLLIDFVMNRSLPAEELVPRLLSRGRAAIGCAPGHLESDERGAVSGG